MLDGYYATTLGGRKPLPASACNAANSAWGGAGGRGGGGGGGRLRHCSKAPTLSEPVHREMNFNYKAPSYRQHTAPL